MPLPEAEKAVLRLADQISLVTPEGFLSEELYEQLRPHWTDGQIFELGLTAAILTGMAKLLFVFDLVSREPSCPIHRPT